MKYLCLVYFEEKTLEGLSKRELDSVVRESLAYDEDLAKSGHMIVAHALQPTRNSTSLRLRNGRFSITDGPFAETKEQLGGFILIEAADLNDAIQAASKIPMARLGSIEVRPTWELNQKQPQAGRALPAAVGAGAR